MPTKLTLSLEEKLIQQAKHYAKSQGKSVSQIVAEFFTVLSARSIDNTEIKAQPVTSKLLGCMADSELDESDYKVHLLNKYQ